MEYFNRCRLFLICLTAVLVTVLKLCHTKKVGKYYWGRCVASDQFVRLYGLTFLECITECQLKPACSSVNYDIRFKRCDINDLDVPLEMGACSGLQFSQKSDWLEDKSALCQPSCTSGMRCDIETATCKFNECGLPPVASNTVMQGNRRSIGSKLLYTCANNPTVSISVLCLQTGTWSPIPSCTVDCGEPSPRPNSHVSAGSTFQGSATRYECDSGYVLTSDSDVTSMTIVCQSSGDWTPTNFQCVVDCGAPPSITGIAIPSGDTWLGSTIVIQCETGYLPDDNDVSSATITCLATGDWSPAAIAFKCLRECNELPTKPNAYIPGSITDVNVEGYVKTYHCNINYIPSPESDSGQIICQNNGEWTESNLECLVDCGAPSAITGVDIPSGDTWLGSTIIIQCETGYLPENSDVSSATITCQATGDWSPAATTFKCLRVATLGTDCNDDSDCLEEKSRCVYNNYMKNPRRKCMCNHNAEYDQATKQCVTQCNQYSNTFTQIEDICINKYNLLDYDDMTVDECKAACIDFGDTCVSFDYLKYAQTCFLGMVTYQQIVDGDPTEIVYWHACDLYTRTCNMG